MIELTPSMVFISSFTLLRRNVKGTFLGSASTLPRLPLLHLNTYLPQLLDLRSLRTGAISTLYSENLENICHVVSLWQMRAEIMFWPSDPIFDHKEILYCKYLNNFPQGTLQSLVHNDMEEKSKGPRRVKSFSLRIWVGK